jgi:CubicO group peptidase (beta-lactamase class C family)
MNWAISWKHLSAIPIKNGLRKNVSATRLGRPALFAAGTDWGYADTNYLILGLVVQSITKKEAYKQIDEYFIKPNKTYQH